MDKFIKLPQNTQCNLVKWKVRCGSRIAKNTLLALFKVSDSDKQEKLKSNTVGIVKELLVAEGAVITSGSELILFVFVFI